MKIVLAGGSGALGRRIAADLAHRGDDIVVLTRTARPERPYRQVQWDGPWQREVEGAVLINLAGELVDRPPTKANIELLTSSRVGPTTALKKSNPRIWIQAGTLAIYGDAGETVLTEESPPADGPPQMAGVARAWERAAAGAPADRQVLLRAGVVLDRNTPALNRLAGLARWGLGGRVGSGRQWVSWLHIDDFLAIVRRAVDDDTIGGVVHATSPNPVRNAELMAALRHVLRRPPSPPTPAPLVRIGAVLLRTDPALALTGRRCVPKKLLDAGFTFTRPELVPALTDLLRASARP